MERIDVHKATQLASDIIYCLLFCEEQTSYIYYVYVRTFIETHTS